MITPQSIIKPIDLSLIAIAEADYVTVPLEAEEDAAEMTSEQRTHTSPSSRSACAKPPRSSNSSRRPRSGIESSL